MRTSPVRALILALAVAMAPLVLQVPAWVAGWCAISWGYLLLRDRYRWAAPSRRLRAVIFLAGMAAVVANAGLRFDGGDFIALLVVMAGIKPLEIRGRRDSMVTVFLAYFLVITSLFVFENLSMTLYLFLSVWITTGVLIQVNDPQETLGRQMRLAARLILVALPLMVMLFILFPRVTGSFWGAPWSRQGRSGFSDTMRIGDVSQLVLTDAPAFSVSFEAAVPKADQQYWRGIVFQRFDGRSWHPARRQTPRRSRISGTELASYTVMLEPLGFRHLFVLDLPVAGPPMTTIMDDNTLVARQSVQRRFRYQAASFLDYRQDVSDGAGPVWLQIPLDQNPRAIALGKQWRRTLAGPEAVVATALAFFREHAFTYTLRPGHLGSNAVDDFLFSSRKGFCEHFASAFALLMRAAGVPTRIVGGYQGGQWNALGEFLTVRQSDAHVWCEVWLADKGWVRVDPTAVVAPNRINAGIEGALTGTGLPAFLSRQRAYRLSRWVETASQTWQAVNIRWNMWFMGFSTEDQVALLKKLGITMGRQGRWLLFMVLPPLFIGLVMLIGRRRRRQSIQPRPDQALKTYGRFLDKLARMDLPKAPHQGPVDHARCVIARYPALKPEVEAIIDRYIGLRYGDATGAAACKDFRLRVRRFNPRRTLAARVDTSSSFNRSNHRQPAGCPDGRRKHRSVR